MLLRSKAVVTLCPLFSLFITLTYLIHQRIMIPHFLQLERQELETCMDRLHHGIRNELEALAGETNCVILDLTMPQLDRGET